ncbi:hypothetical protein H6F61_11635 [Cyanobacteria bacterium FACHB-472]|nr:hypothetical protein [Cyanobacteria bacterium FACHB-472]
MTTQQLFLEQAKQRTIALLIANSLEAQGIAVKTNLKGDCLRVMLESSQVPNQSAMVAFIRRGMMKLGAASIKTVKVYGKQAEASTSAWSQDIDLEDAIALSCPSSNSLPQIASSTKKSTSPTNKSPSSQPVHAFQNSFLSACFLFLCLIPYSALIWLVVIAAWMGIKSHPIIAIALINVVGTTIIFHYCVVYISPRGIKAYDFWVKYYFVEWSSITAVRPFNLLGLKYLLVSSTQSPKTLWVPLFLAERHRFRQLVSKYAGTEHTFTQNLFGKYNQNPPLQEINGQIKAGWLAALIVGGATLYLGTLSLRDASIRFDCIIEALIIFILAAKIQNKSRAAAVFMLIYYILGRLFSLLELIGVLGQAETKIGGRIPIVEVPLFLIISIVLIGCFVEGVRGTFAYHRLVELQNTSSSQT